MKTKEKSLTDLFNQIELQTVMSSPPITVEIDDPLTKVHEKFRKSNIKHLIVVNKEKKIAGVITLNDLFKVTTPKQLSDGSWYFEKPEDLDQFPLYRIMAKKPLSMLSNERLIDAMNQMVSGGFGCIPIVDDQMFPVGVVTQSDIIKVVTKIFKR